MRCDAQIWHDHICACNLHTSRAAMNDIPRLKHWHFKSQLGRFRGCAFFAQPSRCTHAVSSTCAHSFLAWAGIQLFCNFATYTVILTEQHLLHFIPSSSTKQWKCRGFRLNCKHKNPMWPIEICKNNLPFPQNRWCVKTNICHKWI